MGVAFLLTDVVEASRERDEQLTARFGYAFDMAVTAMSLLSLDGRYVRVNAAHRTLLGRSSEELRELGPLGVTHPDDRAAKEGALPRLLRGEIGTYHADERHLRPDGSIAHVRVAVRRVDGDDGPLGFFVESVDLTETLRMQARLEAANDRLRLLADASDDVVLFRIAFTPEPRFEYVTAGAAVITGYTPEEHYADPSLLLQSVHPHDRDRLQAHLDSRTPAAQLPLRFVRPDGQMVWTESHATPITDDEGQVVGVEGIAYVAAGREVARARAARDARFESLVRNAADVVLLISPEGVVEYASPAVEQHLGVTPDQVVGRNSGDFCHDDDRPALLAAFYRASPGRSVPVEYRARHADGGVRWMEGLVTNLAEDPNVGAYVFNARDITERRRLTDQLRRRAYADELTGLPNRLGLRERIERAVAADDAPLAPFAVLRVAADGLASIVEVFGHQHADRLVVAVADRLRAVVPPGATLARTGADDFAVLADGGTGTQGVTDTAMRVLAAFEQPFELDDEPFQLDASVGVAVYPGHGRDADSLLRRAERACRAAGERGAGFVVYSSRLDDTSAQHVALLGRLREAIETSQLELHYQPKVALGTRTAYGAEALLRWQHPEFGFVPPDRFIPLAERTGLIKPLTLWVVDAAARQLYEWRRDGIDLSVAVNITPRNLQDPAFPEAVATVLETWGLPPSSLWLELTERAVMTDPEVAVAACRRLVELGVPLSLDDFGTGQSSFAYVASLPITEIKIDGRFVQGIASDGANAGITRAIIGLAHHLGHSVIAEGVEDDDTLGRLADLGCDAVQGYHVSRPLPAGAFRDWLATSSWARG